MGLWHTLKSKFLQVPTGFIISLGLVGIAMLLCWLFYPGTVATQSLKIPVNSHRYVVARLFTPTTTSAPYPGMVLCHGVNANKEIVTPLAVELARGGIASVVFDFAGSGESEFPEAKNADLAQIYEYHRQDAQAVVAYLRSSPQLFDPSRLGIGGHSLGGMTAVEVAMADPRLQATTVMGMSGTATPTLPKNLFLGVGLYDQLNPVAEVRQMYQAASAGDGATSANDFTTGTARRFFISPHADHIIEPYDAVLIQQAVRWTQQAFQVPVTALPAIFPGYLLGLLLLFFGGISTAVFWFIRTGKPVTYPAARQLYRYLVAVIIICLMGFIWSLGSSGLGPSRSASNVLIFCYGILVFTNYALLDPLKWLPVLRILGLYSVLLLEPFVLPALISGLPEIFQQPVYLINLPIFLLQWPIFFIYNYTTVLKFIFTPIYTLNLEPSALFFLLLFVELIWPGITLTGLERIAVWLVKWLRQPIHFSGFGNLSKRTLGLLSFLGFIFIGVIYQRIQDGLLELAAGNGSLAILLLFQMVILPLGIIIVILRSKWFQSLEKG